MERGIIVEKQELMFLLSCNGCRTCPAAFLSKADARPAEPEEILKGLFQKGWVKNDQSCFQVQKPLSDAVKQITEAKRVFNFCHGNPERELMFLYPGESLLAVQEIFRRKNAVRMTRVEKNEIFLFLNEQGFTGIDEDWEPLPCPGEMEELLPKKLEQRGELKAYPWVRLLVSVTDGQTGEMLERTAVFRKGFSDMTITQSGREDGREYKSAEPYDAEKFTEKIWKWIEEGEE